MASHAAARIAESLFASLTPEPTAGEDAQGAGHGDLAVVRRRIEASVSTLSELKERRARRNGADGGGDSESLARPSSFSRTGESGCGVLCGGRQVPRNWSSHRKRLSPHTNLARGFGRAQEFGALAASEIDGVSPLGRVSTRLLPLAPLP